ncbi:MAG TPA: beta-propeller fold lactonase family protein [Pyrinomonadaceae bacterium]|nr:beta-propeller fold lactonase family protein [Pyrinomonadaceae bacterium]
MLFELYDLDREVFPMGKPKSPTLLLVLAVFFLGCSPPANVEQNRDSNHERTSATATPAEATVVGFVYTANEGENSISAIDLSTGQVKTAPVRVTPHNIQVSRDGSLLLVVGSPATETGGHSDPQSHDAESGHGEGHGTERGRLLIIDPVTLDSEGAVGVEVGRSPAHVIADPQGKLAYVTNGADDTVSVVDVAQRKVVREIEVGDSPHGMRMRPDGSEIYVANTGDGSVSVIDVAAAKEGARIPVGEAPVQVAFAPDSHRVYVSSSAGNSVSVVDTATRKQIASVPVGRKPIQLFVTPDGRYVYVANEGTKENPDNTTSVIDTRTNQVVATVETGSGAHGVVVSDDGSRAFIANSIDSTVSVIDTATQKVTRNIKVGKGSGGISFRRANPVRTR